MIRSFGDRATERLWMGAFVRRLLKTESRPCGSSICSIRPAISRICARRPRTDWEALAGDRGVHFLIRINDQWRICFIWTKEGPEHVEIVDYH